MQGQNNDEKLINKKILFSLILAASILPVTAIGAMAQSKPSFVSQSTQEAINCARECKIDYDNCVDEIGPACPPSKQNFVASLLCSRQYNSCLIECAK